MSWSASRRTRRASAAGWVLGMMPRAPAATFAVNTLPSRQTSIELLPLSLAGASGWRGREPPDLDKGLHRNASHGENRHHEKMRDGRQVVGRLKSLFQRLEPLVRQALCQLLDVGADLSGQAGQRAAKAAG